MERRNLLRGMSMEEKCIFCGLKNCNCWSDAFKAGWRRLGNGVVEVIACPAHKDMLAVKL